MEVSPMRRLSAVLLVAVAVAGCKKSEPPAAAPPAAPVAAPEAAPAAPQGTTIKGKVLERLDAPPYSYLKIAVGKEEMWAAVPKTDLTKGKEVSVVNAMPMTNFESKTLNRKFDTVYFGTLEGATPALPDAGKMAGSTDPSPANMAAQHANVGKGAAEVGNVKVAKATGADARTVAEVYAQKAQLKDKPVTIKGKVVKYNAGIMGKNWLHLRDGTGKADVDNDLTVTSDDAAAVGDVVTVKGTVRIDQDFSHGYKYPVLVDGAKISK
jgi:uncharacterized protein YdeI (BOF family)